MYQKKINGKWVSVSQRYGVDLTYSYFSRQRNLSFKARRRKQREKDKDFYKSKEWRTLRYEALKIHGARCMVCGRTAKDGVKINVDHIKPFQKYPELALDINNLQILCGACNHGKGGWDETDWRKK